MSSGRTFGAGKGAGGAVLRITGTRTRDTPIRLDITPPTTNLAGEESQMRGGDGIVKPARAKIM